MPDTPPPPEDAAERCVLCAASGISTPATVRVEAHHIGGHHHDPHATVPLCAPHHREVTERIRAAGADMRPQPTVTQTIVQGLRAVAAFLLMLAAALFAWADRLLADALRRGEVSHV